MECHYWYLESVSICGVLGKVEITVPSKEEDVGPWLIQQGFSEFFTKKDHWIIGKSLKDFFSFLKRHGIEAKVRPLDVEIIQRLDHFREKDYPLAVSPRDLLFQMTWYKGRLKDPELGKIYTHLIEGMFPVLASMETTPMLFDGVEVYPRYNIGTTDSGRIYSTATGGFFSPQMVKAEERGQYCSPHDYKLICADQCAMEMRIIAHLSGDKNLISVFEQDLDIHDIVARLVLNKKSKAPITEKEREVAKGVNFLIIFGGTAYGLSQQTGMTQQRADRFIRSFYDAFPGVEEWTLKTKISAMEQGYIKSIFGRTKVINPNGNVDAELRSVQNFCVQSAAADINTLAFRGLFHLLPLQAKMLLTLHDGVVLGCPLEVVEEACSIVHTCCENPPGLRIFGLKLQVPLKVKVTVSNRWC